MADCNGRPCNIGVTVVWLYPESMRSITSAGARGAEASRGGDLKIAGTSLYAFNVGPGIRNSQRKKRVSDFPGIWNRIPIAR